MSLSLLYIIFERLQSISSDRYVFIPFPLIENKKIFLNSLIGNRVSKLERYLAIYMK